MQKNARITKAGLYVLGIAFLLSSVTDAFLDAVDPDTSTADYIRQLTSSILMFGSFAFFAFSCFNALNKAVRTEMVMREKEVFLHEVLNNIPVAVFAKDVKKGYRWILWNKASVDLLELPAEKAIGRTDYDFFPKSEADFFRKTDENVMAGGKIVDIPIESVTTKKRGTWFSHTKKVPIYDEQGKPSFLLGICDDITDRQKIEDRLRDYEAVIKYSDDAVIITTPEVEEPGPVIIYVNDAFTQITGYTAEEAIGKSPRILQGPKTDRIRLAQLKESLRSGQPHVDEFINYRKDGTEYWLSISIFPIPDENGKIKNFAAIERDITEVKIKEEKLRNAVKFEFQKEQAESANHLKSDFLANMSHELRTPLNSILGMTRLLLGTHLDAEQKEITNTAYQSSTNLLEIVNDILDLSKIEANQEILETIGFDLNYVLQSVVASMQHQASEKKILIVRDEAKIKLPYVIGDPTRVSRILTNLVSNAIKYTDKGHVQIKTSFQLMGENAINFKCEIVDTGIGIATEKHKSIFDKFVQADSSTTRRYGGSGLGLAITKQLVELMSGRIGVESRIGSGSTFWFTVPFATTKQLDRNSMRIRHRVGSGTVPALEAHILMAEDNIMNRLLLTKLMQRFGVKNYKIVNNGLEVMQAYQEAKWDIVLMDVHMPELNGYEATAAIRALENKTDIRVPIVAMTANAMVGDREKCLRNGMDDYISKPLNFDELQDILGQWIKVQIGAPRDEKFDPIDLAQIHTIADGDPKFEKELARAFIKQSDINLATMTASCVGGENLQWTEAAHTFKGSANGIGAVKLGLLCAEAQEQHSCIQKERQTVLDLISTEYKRAQIQLGETGLLT